MVQLGEILPLLDLTFVAALRGAVEAAKQGAPIFAKNGTKYFLNKKINDLNKKFPTSEGSGITLTNNEI